MRPSNPDPSPLYSAFQAEARLARLAQVVFATAAIAAIAVIGGPLMVGSLRPLLAVAGGPKPSQLAPAPVAIPAGFCPDPTAHHGPYDPMTGELKPNRRAVLVKVGETIAD